MKKTKSFFDTAVKFVGAEAVTAVKLAVDGAVIEAELFINGQYMEHDAINIQQAGSSLLLKVNNDSIGYDLETDDEILAIGKFNS